jgi:acetyl-CoA C-acetyltransferase
MLTAALDGLVARFGLQGARLGEVAAGAVLKHSRDFNLTRETVLGSRLSPSTPAYDVQQACGTGLETTIHVANKIALGQIENGIAGGVDTASDAPIAVNEDLRRVLLQVNRAKGIPQRLALLRKLRPTQVIPETPRNAEPRTGMSMGEHAAITARQWGISREEQDQLALASHRNLAAAWSRGFFDDLATPYLGLQKDQNMRPDASMESLARLKPVFGKDGSATMTAGNSTPLSDGAATVLLSTDAWAREHRLPVLAHFIDAETAAVDYIFPSPLVGEGRQIPSRLAGEGRQIPSPLAGEGQGGGYIEGLLMAPVYAVPRLLERNKLSLQEFDFYEIHEAFASTVLATLKAWEDPAFSRDRLGLSKPLGPIDRSRLNVTGSSLAAGHPFAATGGRIVATLAKLLAEKGSGRGLISICAAGGQGVVAILEAA